MLIERKRSCSRCGSPKKPNDGRLHCQACYDEAIRILRIGAIAHRAVQKAKSIGLLPILDGSISCVDCGGIAHQYDHRDYRKPLDVVPVCRSCNQRRGRAAA